MDIHISKVNRDNREERERGRELEGQIQYTERKCEDNMEETSEC